jgi:hypothetical protein
VFHLRHPRRSAAIAAALLAAAALAAIPAWRAGFAWARDSGRLEAWANRRPERVRVEWRTIRSPFPGRFEIEGLRVAGRTPRQRWEVLAERAAGTLNPWPLVYRELRFESIAADGVRVRVARTARPEEPERPPVAGAPQIGGLPPGPAPPPPARALPWSFSFHGVELERLEEVWIDDRILRGSARGNGGFELRRRRDAEILPSQLELRGVTVEASGGRVADAVDGRVRFRVGAYPYRGAGAATVLPRFVGEVALDGRLDPAAAIEYLLRGWPTLELESGLTTVSTRLRLARGRFLPGSELRLTNPHQRLRFLDLEARGGAELEARVESAFGSARLTTEVRLARWELGRPGEAAILFGEDLRLTALAAEPGTERPPRAVDLAVDLGRARAPDLRFVGDFLPPAARLEITAGSAEVTGGLRFATASRAGTGTVSIRGRGLKVEALGQGFGGDFEADLRLSEPDLAAATFSLAGTKVALRRFTAETSAGDRLADWWADATRSRGRVELRRPLRFGGEFVGKLADTRPFVAFYEVRRDLPEWAERLLTVDGISVAGGFDWSAGRFVLDRALVPLAHGELRAKLRLEREDRRGKLLARWRRLAVGVELAGSERQLRLRDVQEWFDDGLEPAPTP